MRRRACEHGEVLEPDWLELVYAQPHDPELRLASGVTVTVGRMLTEGTLGGGNGVWWQIDAVLLDRPHRPSDPFLQGSPDQRMVVPGLLLRPCLNFPLNASQSRAAFQRWLDGIQPNGWQPEHGIPSLVELLSVPTLRALRRLPEPLSVGDTRYALATQRVLQEAREICEREGREPLQLLRSLPFLVELAATRSETIQLPSPRVEGVDGSTPPHRNYPHRSVLVNHRGRLARLRKKPTRGRPPAVTLPSIAHHLFSAIGLERYENIERPEHLTPARWRKVCDNFGPMRERFVAETCVQRDQGIVPPEIEAVRRHFGWRNGAFNEPYFGRRRSRFRTDVATTFGRLKGRSEPGRGPVFRGLVPYLVADLRTLARPFAQRWLVPSPHPNGLVDLDPESSAAVVEANIWLLVQWLRTGRFIETLDVVTGADKTLFESSLTPGKSFEDVAEQRHLPFHFVEVRDDLGDRWVSGFADSVDDLLRRIEGDGDGQRDVRALAPFP